MTTKNHKSYRHNLLVIEQYCKCISLDELTYRLSVKKDKLEKIINNWILNDYFVIVPSKMNEL